MMKRVSVFVALAILLSACATLSKSPATREFECGWPRFTVTYPSDWVTLSFKPEIGQVFRAGEKEDGPPDFVVSVGAHQGMPLKYYSRALLPALGRFGSEFKIIQDQAATLKDGTPAWEIRLNWVLNSGEPLTSLFLTTVKGDMWITVAVTNQLGDMPKELEAIAFSLAVSPEKEEVVEVPADIREFLDGYSAAIANHDLDGVMVHVSDEFLHYGRKKPDIESFFKGVIDLVPSYEIVTTYFQNNGDTVKVAGYAVIAGGKFAIPGMNLKKSEAGQWQLYGNQQM